MHCLSQYRYSSIIALKRYGTVLRGGGAAVGNGQVDKLSTLLRPATPIKSKALARSGTPGARHPDPYRSLKFKKPATSRSDFIPTPIAQKF